MKSYDVTIQMKALCLYLHMVLFVCEIWKFGNLVEICFWLNLAVKGLKIIFFPRIHFSVMFSSHLFPFKFHPRKSLFHATCQDCIAEIQHLLELWTIG